jgi:hypothetical protein
MEMHPQKVLNPGCRPTVRANRSLTDDQPRKRKRNIKFDPSVSTV